MRDAKRCQVWDLTQPSLSYSQMLLVLSSATVSVFIKQDSTLETSVLIISIRKHLTHPAAKLFW